VADSSLSYDREQKASLYAESGVPEYWIVNLVDRVVEVRRQPRSGRYEQLSVHPKGERLKLLAFPDVELAIDGFLR
jgi:Uma2 family endonuclease